MMVRNSTVPVNVFAAPMTALEAICSLAAPQGAILRARQYRQQQLTTELHKIREIEIAPPDNENAPCA